MIRKIGIFAAMLTLSACASLPFFSLPFTSGSEPDVRILTNTEVSLSQNNFTVIKANVVGESWGVNLVGLIPITSPKYTEAITGIYEQLEPMEGQPRTLVNIVHHTSSNFYLLFSIPRISVRADIVEFKAEEVE